MRKNRFKGENEIFTRMTEEHNRPIVKRPSWTKTAHLAKTKKMIWGVNF